MLKIGCSGHPRCIRPCVERFYVCHIIQSLQRPLAGSCDSRPLYIPVKQAGRGEIPQVCGFKAVISEILSLISYEITPLSLAAHFILRALVPYRCPFLFTELSNS
jgi:hypothetical protein